MDRKDSERRVRIGRIERFIEQLELAALVSPKPQNGIISNIADKMRKEFKLDGPKLLGKSN